MPGEMNNPPPATPLPKTISQNVYLCAAQFVFMAESWWQMSDVANTWSGHWTVDKSPSAGHQDTGLSVVETFANIPWAMRIENRKYLWPAQHITHLISILVFLGKCWAWIFIQLDWIFVTPSQGNPAHPSDWEFWHILMVPFLHLWSPH